ncbi:MAG: TolC family protein [Magnetococcales bacterium]|nr:TolC family protein [Magnetococcales bacterium]
MNVEWALSRRMNPPVRWLVGLLLPCLPMQSAWSASIPDLLDDPLASRPAVLSRGKPLPGDERIVSCSTGVDHLQPLSLIDAVDLALCNNTRIKAEWAAIKVRAAASGEAKAAFLPTLSGTLSRLNTSTHHPDFPGADTSDRGKTVSAGWNWRIFDFGGRISNLKAAEALLAAALADHDATLQRTLNTTVGAYFDAMTAQASLNARLQATELTNKTLQATNRREERGMAARNDVLQAKTALAKARLAEQRARGDELKSMSMLSYVLGVSQQTPFRLSEPEQTPAVESMHELSDWLEVTRARHPALTSARAQWQAAQERVTTTRSEGLPTLDFVSNFYRNGYPNQGLQSTRSDTTTIGVTLTVPVFEGFARTYKIRGAQAQVEQSEAQWRDIEQQVLLEVVKAYADAQASLVNLGAADGLLSAARETLTSSMNRYDRGAADILELLSVQGALTDAQHERIRCLSEWQSARLRLWATAGVLGREKLIPETSVAQQPREQSFSTFAD